MSAESRSRFLEDDGLLSRNLMRWYRRQGRDLPWRRDKDPWRVWVSEIMLQQTTVDTVMPRYEQFLKRFPSPSALARASEAQAVKAWEGLGYYRRVRNLRKAAALVVQRGFPRSLEEWRELPGIGAYTAAMLSSILGGRKSVALDGNLLRVGARLFHIRKNVDSPAGRRAVERALEVHMPTRNPGDFNQALMDLGALICRPGRPHCERCPLRSTCRGSGNAHSLPIRKKRPATLSIRVAVALIRRKDGKYLLDLRSDEVVMGGLWEFPGGKIEPGETPAEALKREIREEAGLTIEAVRELAAVDHAYTRFRVKLYPFLCTVMSGRARPRDKAVAKLRWFRPHEFSNLAMPAGSRKILGSLESTLLLGDWT
ncbi:MAG: A/G-specific adenine glycosylase [Planctomycetota bacterium]